MALIRYLKRAPGATAGTVRDVAMQFAKPLVDLGFAEYHTRQMKAEAPKTASHSTATDSTTEEKTRKKREYKRRDLHAETD